MLTSPDFQISEENFNLLRTAVYQHCGITLSDEKQAMVRARIAKHVRAGGLSSADEYLERALVNRKGPDFTTLIDSISTNLTSFFREADHFAYLANVAFPRFAMEKKETGESRLLGWSAACSSGEEAYSLAMVLSDAAAAPAIRAQRLEIRVLATDISTKVLQIARDGLYNEERISRIPPSCKEKHFRPVNSGDHMFAVSPELKSFVHFRNLNLMDTWKFNGPFDFIFCRNVMIYFDRPTQETLIERFWKCLRPGGLLFTGHSESLSGMGEAFINRGPSIYEKPE